MLTGHAQKILIADSERAEIDKVGTHVPLAVCDCTRAHWVSSEQLACWVLNNGGVFMRDIFMPVCFDPANYRLWESTSLHA